MRAITFSQPMTSQKPLYRQLGILNLEDFVKVQNCMFFFVIFAVKVRRVLGTQEKQI